MDVMKVDDEAHLFVELPDGSTVEVYLHVEEEGIICDILSGDDDSDFLDGSYWFWSDLEKEE